MTRDPRLPITPQAFDDDAIGDLVRAAAAGWAMPAIRLDEPSWRDRVRSPRARRVEAARTWFGRIGQATGAAVALTVAGALVAVILTGPGPEPGKSPEPTAGQSPGASSAAGTPLPQVFINGEPPTPSTVLVEMEEGDFALVDLEPGVISAEVRSGDFGSDLRVLSDGSMLCLCLHESGNADTMPTDIEVSLERFGADGSRLSSTVVETFAGAADPRDTGIFRPERPPHVRAATGWSDDGRYGYVGWSLRAHPVWRSGIDVIDLSNGDVVGRLELPDRGTGEGDARTVVEAPLVAGTLGRDGVLISRPWFGWDPVTSETPNFRQGVDVFESTFLDGSWSDALNIDAATDCGAEVLRGGPLADGGRWLVCATGGSFQMVIRRLGSDGAVLGDVRLSGQAGIDGDMTATSPDGTKLFAWSPATATLTRVDLATGETATGQGPIPTAARNGPLSAFGHWLAPVVAAKSFLRGAVIVSPDGTRAYALGVRGGTSGPETTGSSGIFVFDAGSMASLSQWPPTADLISLALSADGRFAYATGLAGVDSAGRRMPGQGASITVFDTESGAVRLVAGQLGQGFLTFPASTLE